MSEVQKKSTETNIILFFLKGNDADRDGRELHKVGDTVRHIQSREASHVRGSTETPGKRCTHTHTHSLSLFLSYKILHKMLHQASFTVCLFVLCDKGCAYIIIAPFLNFRKWQ